MTIYRSINAFREAVADLDRGRQLTSFLTRIEPYYGDLAPSAFWLLDQVADAGSATRASLVHQSPRLLALRRGDTAWKVLDWLTLDQYLVKVADGSDALYSWRHEPLRRIWRLRRS